MLRLCPSLRGIAVHAEDPRAEHGQGASVELARVLEVGLLSSWRVGEVKGGVEQLLGRNGVEEGNAEHAGVRRR